MGTADYMEKLKCSKCKKPLSYYPIYSDSDQKSICGRCPAIENGNMYRNLIYEISMENNRFPCSNISNGCLEELNPNEVPEHEIWCEFGKYHCPYVDFWVSNCDWQGFACDIYEHFEQQHADFVLQDGKFEVDLISSYTGKFLFSFGQEYFVLTKTMDSNKKELKCTVKYVGNSPNVSDDYKVKISLKNGNGSKKMRIEAKIGQLIIVKSDDIVDKLEDPLSIIAEIEVYEDVKDNIEVTQKKIDDVNYELIEAMKCLVCSEYMLPPVYLCVTGHSVCWNCTSKIRNCPNCEKEFKKTQNFALAHVISFMKYPCKNEGCHFSCNSKDIKKHEASCMYEPVCCPLQDYINCCAKPIISKVHDHLYEVHQDLLYTDDEVSYSLESDDYENVFLIPCNGKICIVVLFNDIDSISWMIQMVECKNERTIFSFEIDINDNSGRNGRMYVKKKCGYVTNDSTSSFRLLHSQVEPYLTDGIVTYNMRIMEEKTKQV